MFNDRQWPESAEIELKFGEEYGLDTQSLYNELRFRKIFSSKEQDAQIKILETSWSNYNAIFEQIYKEDTKSYMKLPIPWIWDIIDEFLYQFLCACK